MEGYLVDTNYDVGEMFLWNPPKSDIVIFAIVLELIDRRRKLVHILYSNHINVLSGTNRNWYSTFDLEKEV